jgi:adenine phosphoribosyltransferase
LSLEQKVSDCIRDIVDFPNKGIVFKDITPVLKDSSLCSSIVDELSSDSPTNTTHFAGIESRGFLFGLPIALKQNKPFVLIRKKGKLPYKTVSLEYDLEYGSAEIEMHVDSVSKGDRVLIHDDLLATGGTALAAAKLIKSQGAEVVGFSFIVELSVLNGRKSLMDYSPNIKSIVKY